MTAKRKSAKRSDETEHWVKKNGSWEEKPEKTMICDGCEKTVAYNKIGLCRRCASTEMFKKRAEAVRLADKRNKER